MRFLGYARAHYDADRAVTTLEQFHVQSQLLDVLAAQYRSSEEALKELVANCWDADATRVDIALPIALSGEPIFVRDNGHGMTPLELRAHY